MRIEGREIGMHLRIVGVNKISYTQEGLSHSRRVLFVYGILLERCQT